MLPQRLRRTHMSVSSEVDQPKTKGRTRPVRQGRRVHAVSLRSAEREGDDDLQISWNILNPQNRLDRQKI